MGLTRLLRGLFGPSPLARRLEVVGPGGEDPDGQVLRELQAAGANLQKPTHMLFYIYASTEAGANRIAQATTTLQLQAEVRPAALGSGWLCLVQGRMVPSLDMLKDYRIRFEALAAAEGGEYDGWEAAVTK